MSDKNEIWDLSFTWVPQPKNSNKMYIGSSLGIYDDPDPLLWEHNPVPIILLLYSNWEVGVGKIFSLLNEKINLFSKF